jgi:hypothetical protein
MVCLSKSLYHVILSLFTTRVNGIWQERGNDKGMEKKWREEREERPVKMEEEREERLL